METSIVLGSDQKPAGLRVRQQMHNSSTNLTITADGLMDLTTGAAQVIGNADYSRCICYTRMLSLHNSLPLILIL